MKSKTITVKDSGVIERRFRLLNFYNAMLIFLAIPCILLILFLILKDFHYFNSRISVFFPILLVVLFLSRYLFFFAGNSELLKDVKSNKIGRYKKNKIIKLWDKIIKENFEDNEEIPSIYLIEGVGNNAFVINSLLLNFIKGFNSIKISKELFDYLSIDELKAIIAHEIGHFKKYISIADRVPFIPFSFSILVTYISIAFLFPVFSIEALVVYFVCLIIINIIITYPFKIFRKDVEFLSDLYAANKYGKLNTINALIKIYQMDNIDILVNLEIVKFMMQSKHMKVKDFQRIKRKIDRRLHKKRYDEKLIKDQVVKYLKGMKFSNKQKLSKDEIKQRNRVLEVYIKSISKLLTSKIIDWDDIDNHIKDARIDSVEYKGFIETLKNNPELQLFRTPDDNIKKMKFAKHPALRERILFIAQNGLSLTG